MTLDFTPRLPKTLKGPSKKQVRQRELVVALGTIKGFNGYLLNLERALKTVANGEYGIPSSVANLRCTLMIYEQAALHQLANLKDIPK